MEICKVESCEREVKVKSVGFCGLHYARWNRHGDPLAWKKPRRLVCSVEDCELRAAAKGFCDLHYRRVRRYGTTEAPIRPTVCGVKNCGRAVQAHALCDRHYRRERSGTTETRYCHYCGSELDPNAHAQRIYCSKFCKEKALCLERRRTHRERWLKKYGLTVAQFDARLEAQGGGCAVCGTKEPPKRGSWHVDHCHDSKKVRGLLCHDCNVGLGNFKDNSDTLRAAALYLER